MSFISRPSALLRRLLRPSNSELAWFRHGQLSIALEILTGIKILEQLPIADERSRHEAISVLISLLVDLDLYDEAVKVYEELNEARRPSFQPEPSPQASADAAYAAAPDPVSAPLDPEHWRLLGDSRSGTLWERRDPDGPPTSD